MAHEKDITLKVVLEHVQAMGNGLHQEIKSLKKHMDDRFNQVDERFKKVDERFTGVENRLENLEADMYVVKIQTKHIAERLDNVEIKQLPKIRKTIRHIRSGKTMAA